MRIKFVVYFFWLFSIGIGMHELLIQDKSIPNEPKNVDSFRFWEYKGISPSQECCGNFRKKVNLKNLRVLLFTTFVQIGTFGLFERFKQNLRPSGCDKCGFMRHHLVRSHHFSRAREKSVIYIFTLFSRFFPSTSRLPCLFDEVLMPCVLPWCFDLCYAGLGLRHLPMDGKVVVRGVGCGQAQSGA